MIDTNILHHQYHYYSDSGEIFKNRTEALLYKNKTQKKVFLYFNDNIYDKVAWSLEPTQSLQSLYKEQAQRIRDSYDYVILCYSGGYDSSNILETFYYNNIKLNKIIMVGALSQDSSSGVDENMNGELYHNAFPYIQQLGLESITQVYDYTTMFNNVSNFSLGRMDDEWVNEIGALYSPHHWFWNDLEKFVVPNNMENKKVAILFGKDKPAMHVIDGKFCFRFVDRSIAVYNKMNTNSNTQRVNFYWDPMNTDILVKQLHAISKVFKLNPPKNNDDMDRLSNNVVYNLKRPILFKSPKSKNPFLSDRDRFMKMSVDSDIFKVYAAGLRKLESSVGLKTIDRIYSKPYFI